MEFCKGKKTINWGDIAPFEAAPCTATPEEATQIAAYIIAGLFENAGVKKNEPDWDFTATIAFSHDDQGNFSTGTMPGIDCGFRLPSKITEEAYQNIIMALHETNAIEPRPIGENFHETSLHTTYDKLRTWYIDNGLEIKTGNTK